MTEPAAILAVERALAYALDAVRGTRRGNASAVETLRCVADELDAVHRLVNRALVAALGAEHDRPTE